VLSGHFTISTFHSKTWDEALIRLIKVFGVDPNTLCMSSILKGILAQKLTPIICDECSLKYEDIESGLTKREKLKLSEYFSECYEQLRFKNIHDLCNKCEKTNGVIGLKPIYEIYKPTKEINSLIINDKFAEARNKWEQVNDGINGITFLDRAKELVVQGLVDPIWVIDTLLEEI
jgi:type II secretory ATPase GspE/PulE/Tfp pilus assembly ATPase PilB-like protein